MSKFGDPSRTPCSGRRKDGQACGAPAIAGGTVCRMHGGSTKAARAVYAANVKEREAARHSSPRRSTPEDALEEELHRTLGQIDWLDRQLNETPNDQALRTAHARERDRLTKITDQMMKKGVRQRKVVLTEKGADMLVGLITGVVRDLGHDPEHPAVRQVVVRNLQQVRDGDLPENERRPALPAPSFTEAEAQPVDF